MGMLVIGVGAEPTPLIPIEIDVPEVQAVCQRGTLRVIVNDYTPVLAFRDANQELAGFEIDIIRYLARNIFGPGTDLNECLELIECSNHLKLDRLESNDVDLIVANMADTAERRNRVSMTGHYLSVPFSPLTGPDCPAFENLDQTTGLRLAIEADTNSAEVAETYFPRVEIIEMTSETQWINALLNNQVDAVLGDPIYNAVAADRMPTLQNSELRIANNNAAIAVAKNQPGLTRYVGHLLTSGQLLALRRRWGLDNIH